MWRRFCFERRLVLGMLWTVRSRLLLCCWQCARRGLHCGLVHFAADKKTRPARPHRGDARIRRAIAAGAESIRRQIRKDAALTRSPAKLEDALWPGNMEGSGEFQSRTDRTAELERIRQPADRQGSRSRSERGGDYQLTPSASAILEIFPRPRPSGQVHLTFVNNTGAVGYVNHVPRAPAMFAATLIGAGTDTRNLLAVFEISDPTRAEGPVLGTADVSSRAKDRPEPRRHAFPIHLVENASCRPGSVGD